MGLIEYIKSLLPKFGKSRILEDARIVRTELENVSIPSFVEAEKIFTGWTFKSEEMKGLIKIFNRNVKSGNNENIVSTIRKGLEKLLDTQELIEDKLQHYLEDDIVSTGVSCLKANLLRCLEGVSFISKYSTKLLNYIYVVETAECKEPKTNYVRDNFSPEELQYIESMFLEFCNVFSSLTKSKQELTKLLEQIPDIVINDANGLAVNSTISQDKLDPLSMHGFSATAQNPIYHLALMVAEWQANRYKLAKETKKVLELRLLNLQLVKEKNPDAKIEQEIEYTQSRIQGLDDKIKKMEESVK